MHQFVSITCSSSSISWRRRWRPWLRARARNASSSFCASCWTSASQTLEISTSMMTVSAISPTWSLRTPILTAQLTMAINQPFTRIPLMELIISLVVLSSVLLKTMMPSLQDLKAGNSSMSKSMTRNTRTKRKKNRSITQKKVNQWAQCARKLKCRVSKRFLT